MTTTNVPSFYSVSINELKSHLMDNDCPESAAKQVFRNIYKRKNTDILSDPKIGKRTFEVFNEYCSAVIPAKIVNTQLSQEDDTVKFLVELHDGKRVETVLVPFNKKYTVCLSSQVGCAMKCSFCFTGVQGLKRNLKTEEIVAQYMLAWNWLETNRPEKAVTPNIVFMGQGEPLHNFEQVKKATEILLTTEGAHLGPRQITLSTAGFLPGLEKFSEFPPINLALSLHSPFDDTRSELIPLNRKYSLEKLFNQIDKLPLMKRQFITCEYLLIKNLNMDKKHADALGDLLKDRPAIINLIPFNDFPGSKYQSPSKQEVEQFKAWMVEKRIHIMVRTTKGDDILAACGQLNVDH